MCFRCVSCVFSPIFRCQLQIWWRMMDMIIVYYTYSPWNIYIISPIFTQHFTIFLRLLVMGVSINGIIPIAGWFISWNISTKNGWWFGGKSIFQRKFPNISPNMFPQNVPKLPLIGDFPHFSGEKKPTNPPAAGRAAGCSTAGGRSGAPNGAL